MNNESLSLSEHLNQLISQASDEFDDILDYIWKSPGLIKHETEIELKKLPLYYPNDPKSATLRWQSEFKKLTGVFPHFIAVGNLFSVVSLFEFYLLQLGDKLQNSCGIKLESVKGQGVTKLFEYFKKINLLPHEVPLYDQVQAALKIRNCLMHSSGMLAWDRHEDDLRRTLSSRTYLSSEDRNRRKSIGKISNEVFINESTVGDRLQVDNMYSFIVSCYLRDYFLNLCESAIKKFGI